MKNIKILSLALLSGLSLSACSSANANKDISSNKTSQAEHLSYDMKTYDKANNHKDSDHNQDESKYLSDLEVVDFMDENFDMSKVEQSDCCKD